MDNRRVLEGKSHVILAAKCVTVAALLSAVNAMATDYTWTGGGDGLTWTDTMNWEGGNVFVSSTGNRLIFQNPVADAVISIPGNLSVNSIKFASGCRAMTLAGASDARITNIYKGGSLTDETMDANASIFVETTEPIRMDVIQMMAGERAVGLAQGAHLEILKPIVDNADKKGRVSFRTLGESKNSYLKIDYDPASADFALDPVEGSFLFRFVGGTNELSAALAATTQETPKPIVCKNIGLLKLNAGAYPREFTLDGTDCTLRAEGSVALGRVSQTKSGGDYTFDLAENVRVDFMGAVVLYGVSLAHRVPVSSSIHYHGRVKCAQFYDGYSEPEAGHRGGFIHLHAPVESSIFYLRGYNIVCEAANVLPSGIDIRWRYEGQSNCGIVDMNGFDQTVTHLNAIGSFNGLDRNLIKSDRPCTLTVNDTFGGANPENARIAVQGAITLVHGGTETQEFNSRDIETTGDIIINSGKIRLSGTAAIRGVKKIVIGADGELVLAGISASPIPSDAVLYLSSAGGGIDATGYQGTALTISNRVCVDGIFVANGSYTSANAGWLTGDKITVNADGFSAWRTAVDGNWEDADKWSKPPRAVETAFVDAIGGSYTVSVTADNAAMGPLAIGNAGEGTATLAVGAAVSWMDGATVRIGAGGRIVVGSGGVLSYNSREHGGDNLLLASGGRLELKDEAQVTLMTQKSEASPIRQQGGDLVVGGDAKLTMAGGRTRGFGSGKTVLKDSALLETMTGADAAGKPLPDFRLYTCGTLSGVTNHLVIQGHARLHPKDDSSLNLDQVVFGYPNGGIGGLSRLDYNSDARSFFGHQIELGATWGFAEMNVTAGTVAIGAYGLGVGGFHYSGRGATHADVVGVLNVSGGVVEVNASAFGAARNRVRGLLLGEGWYDRKTADSGNLFTGHVNLSGGAITNLCGAVILGAGAAKGVWSQTGGEFANTSDKADGPMILGWLGGEGAFILSNGTVKVANADIATYVGGAETNLTPWVLEAEAPSSQAAATGLLSLQGGVFTTAGDVVVGQDGNGTIEVGEKGALFSRTLDLRTSAAEDGRPAHSATLRFKAGSAACGRITLSGALKSVSGAMLEFDLTDWDRHSRLKFLKCNGLEGSPVDWGNIVIIGVEKSDFCSAGGSRYVFRQNARGISIGKKTGGMVLVR